MATILSQVGWPVWLLTGGYKTYRRAVNTRLYDEAPALNLVLLDGHTGTAKTEILARLAGQGVQTLDLEALASHRGSLFGAVAGHPQPSQKLVESRLLAALDQLDPSRPIENWRAETALFLLSRKAEPAPPSAPAPPPGDLFE